MKKLDDFINENRPLFDDEQPGKQHEAKFINLLNDQQQIKNAERFAITSRWLKLAAAIIIIAGFGFGILAILYNPTPQPKNAENALPAEITEMEQYYAMQTQEKLNRIEKLAGSEAEGTQVKNMLLQEIDNLNASSEALKSEYLEGKRDKRLVDAIKNNYRVLSNLLDKVADQLAEPTKESSQRINRNLKSQKYESIIS
jgi:hypothetical protein